MNEININSLRIFELIEKMENEQLFFQKEDDDNFYTLDGIKIYGTDIYLDSITFFENDDEIPLETSKIFEKK